VLSMTRLLPELQIKNVRRDHFLVSPRPILIPAIPKISIMRSLYHHIWYPNDQPDEVTELIVYAGAMR
jgi:hypothetical protein